MADCMRIKPSTSQSANPQPECMNEGPRTRERAQIGNVCKSEDQLPRVCPQPSICDYKPPSIASAGSSRDSVAAALGANAKPEDDIDPSLLVEAIHLGPRAIFGINGQVNNGLFLHHDRKHIVFPLGNKVSVANLKTNRQEFLSGHTNKVSCIDISRSGKYVASGQVSHMGFRALVIMWDYAERKEIARHDLHKVLVQTICFTAEDKFLVSIGGIDDNSVIVFDIEANTPICRAVAAKSTAGIPLFAAPLHKAPSFFLVCGDRHLRMWSIQRDLKKLAVHDVAVGKYQRRFTGIYINPDDKSAFLGTMTGDVVKIHLSCCDMMNVTRLGRICCMAGAYGTLNTRKPYGKDCNRFTNGIRNVVVPSPGRLLIGAGDGTVELIEERKDVSDASFKDYPSPTWPRYRTVKNVKVNGAISSLCQMTPVEYYVATEQNEIYKLNINTFETKLLKTCHLKSVYAIAFPRGISTVFATSGYESIRIWSIARLQELLRIMVYNFHCPALSFSMDGNTILSAWNDGVIRAFTPISGRLIFAIPNAHNKGCSALCVSKAGRLILTGGVEGQVRVWKIEPYRQSLVGVLKDHAGPITSLCYNTRETEAISSSSDGCCVIWDMVRMCRKRIITANTQFMCARYFPTSVHLLTCGSDGRISYWMPLNGQLIRELEGSKKSPINWIHINQNGDYFLSVGTDQKVKYWDYARGMSMCYGDDHAAAVLAGEISPCGKFFITGSEDGCVIIWDIPEHLWGKATPTFPTEDEKSRQKDAEALASKESANKRPQPPKKNSKENISGLVANTPKGSLICVECPPVNTKKQPDINEECHYTTDIRKC